ncbi:MAG: putative tpr repeat protein [Parcubacteria group bacterium Gr01-1014_2]|nr:MAG: putative tpr repeat protein [Parcubacteria group bacterium Gr01-1014_2]
MTDIDFLRKVNIEEHSSEPEATLASSTLNRGRDLLKYSRLLVYILVFLVPLFFLPWTSEILEFNKQLLIFTLAAASLILYFGQVITDGRLTVRKSFANYAVLIFIAAFLLTLLFSDFRYQSIFGSLLFGLHQSLLSLAGFVILFFLILNVFDTEDIPKLLNIFGISLFLSLFLGTLEFWLPFFKILGVSQKNFNTIGTLNSLGMMAALLLVFSFSRLGLEKKSYFNYLKIPAIALSLLFLLILNWWVLWLAAISGMVFVLISNSLGNWRVLNHLWPAVVVLIAVIFMVLNFNLAGILGISLPLEVLPSFGASLTIAKNVLSTSPLFGVGPENFTLAYDLYKPLSINNTAFWNARFSEPTSELFNSLISFGLIGSLAFLLLIFTGFYLSFPASGRSFVGGKNKGLLPIFATLVAVWVLYPFNTTLAFSFYLVLGLLALSFSSQKDELIVDLEKSPKHSLITIVFFVGILALTVISSYFTVSRYVANIKFAKALASQDVDSQTRLLVEAINLDRSEGMYSRALANLLVSEISQELKNLNDSKDSSQREGITSRVQNFSTTVINLTNETSQRNPEDSLNWLSRALVYESLINLIDGSDQWAVKMYQEYSKLSPKDPTPYLRSGNINLTKAEFLRQIISRSTGLNTQSRANFQNQILETLKLAEENYKKAVELKPNYVLAIYNLGAVYEREGRTKDAIKQLEITKAVNPLDANIALQLGLLYYRDSQKEKSFNEFQRATTIFPDFSNARWYLALLYEEKGQLANALAELYKIREFNRGNQILENKISELEKGIRKIPPQSVTGVVPLEEQNQEQ